jgi:hypothetical protein
LLSALDSGVLSPGQQRLLPKQTLYPHGKKCVSLELSSMATVSQIVIEPVVVFSSRGITTECKVPVRQPKRLRLSTAGTDSRLIRAMPPRTASQTLLLCGNQGSTSCSFSCLAGAIQSSARHNVVRKTITRSTLHIPRLHQSVHLPNGKVASQVPSCSIRAYPLSQQLM